MVSRDVVVDEADRTAHAVFRSQALAQGARPVQRRRVVYHRTERDYAYGALWAASLRQAAHLDGFADLKADASISYVDEDPI